jgi:hypothetical protein
MRSSVAVFATFAAVSGGCIIGPTTSSSGSGGSTTSATTTTAASSSTGGSACDSQPSCDACTTCATKNVCAQAVGACEQNSACVGLEQCLDFCGSDPDCQQQCVDNNQVGVDDYTVKIGCLYCSACPKTCAGYATCSKG